MCQQCNQEDIEKTYKRYREQCTQAFAINGRIRCQGTQPSRPDGREHKGCGKWVRIDHAYKCLYCSFWFCATCAEKHFGKTREQHREEIKAAGDYHGIL